MNHTKEDLLADLILAVFRLNGLAADWGDEFVAQENLSSARWKMLGALALSDQPQTAPQIAARMGVTRQGAQKQLNMLIQAKLIELRPNPMHKSSPLYELTESGRITYNTIDERSKAHASQVATLFSAVDLKTTVKVLHSLIDVYGPTQ